MKTKLHGSVIVTYRCNAHCNMCNVWKLTTKSENEVTVDVLQELPKMFFANVTGGEPFIRRDLEEIIWVLREKSKRIVISTNGSFTKRIVSLCEKFPDVGIRISIEGLPKAHDAIRDLPHSYDQALRTLFELQKMGMKDIGFAMTVQDRNFKDLVYLYYLARSLGYEFATATLHNSHYFNKWDNKIVNKERVSGEFKKLVKELLQSKRPKDWFRAYFNYGLVKYIHGEKRLLPCEMGQNGFFLDPWGDVLPCNGMDMKLSMGNLKEKSWDEIWNSKRAQEVRKQIKNCKKNCWMIGSAAPAIRHFPLKPISWVFSKKVRILLSKDLDIN